MRRRYPETDFYKQRIEAFNQANAGKILVDLKIIPRGGGNDYEQKVNMGAAAGELPDVVDMDGPYVANFAYSKLLLPLDDLLDKNSEWFQDYVPAMLQQGTFDGKLYALGAMESSVGVYFNKKIFADLGLPEPPTSVEKAWTFDEFAAVLEQLKQKLPWLDSYIALTLASLPMLIFFLLLQRYFVEGLAGMGK